MDVFSTATPRKLKDTCDSCARAKVKCGRGHPVCRRCARRRIPCRYSPSRRGKAAEQADRLLTGSDDFDLIYGAFSLSADFGTPPLRLPDLLSPEALSLEGGGLPSSLLSPAAALGHEPGLDDLMGDDSAADGQRLLLATLQSLCVLCAEPSPGIDTVLMTNTTATANMAALVRPGCCAPLATLQTMLVLVCCSSIVDAYRQTFVARDGADSLSDRRGIRLDIPVTVGNFLLGNDSKHKILANLVLGDLARLENIVKRVAVDGKDGDGNGGCDLSSTLKALVQEKLETTVRAIEAKTSKFSGML